MTYYELISSDDQNIIQGLNMDKLTFITMKELNLKCFRSSKNRSKDSKKAKALYGDKVNLKDYAIHHTFRGLVGLAPMNIHKAVHHYGYFYRLDH